MGVKPKDVEPTERPICACGKPATHQVQLSVRRLELQGDRTHLYWGTSYQGAHTSIETVVCDDCVRSKINVTLSVDATVEKAKPTVF